MSPIAIRVENLGKRYRRGVDAPYYRASEILQALPRAALSTVAGLFRGKANGSAPADAASEFWALRDVSFELRQGEVLGVIGRNGAGKSTLLKILSRITEPTTGRFGVRGVVASLLEVGTGFHPELTGRENIYLSGTILGMRRAEIARRFDEIVDFAEIEGFLDTPVKRYSSGMYVRLGFAIAAHLQPDVLIVDEVLAVGDAAFQKKCLGKMGAVAGDGRTVLFVSHNMTAVQSICDQAVLLEQGKVAAGGDTRDAVATYLSDTQVACPHRQWEPEEAPVGDGVRLRSLRIQPHEEGKTLADSAIDVTIEFEALRDLEDVNIAFQLSTTEDVCVFSTCSPVRSLRAGWQRYCMSIPDGFLNEGSYSILLVFVTKSTRHLLLEKSLLVFEVPRPRSTSAWYGRRPGLVRLETDWTTEGAEEHLHQSPGEPQ
ncbi:ABC transporter ATP-binding protein [Lignipirellula cremea]|uniref:Teichoic acids export ATP-binding protein TagH n=1 Tax=Lignipirellula cremea TaxID=2528010 RepID=A0A518DL22_9BACT|nr:ABC transporter ATP-binding protein [Lignipirellula cremea]QDU92538.1 Teichoic acids export ATP-binding protein TagH [Lignipirellula cremea]